ncbi:type II toxin-antitoxin system PemK/MazF family toxin [Streptomonospora sp. S1-112]|uniref:Type II toxin-antitoxin system PemK/MazF family toxin n=1 Tax=Streptomonospora mangrovi TaxID=2883123 RepID=A0A9X3NHA0_9ACTN|nr:type II toxin-antitoxin system PemK/MazF family toxin [Streptomonospora mangrovi]MDA0563704.1 type II toxin-antitoxin system PemK/MazF family toxin [Streptomonospora mangrovi]
MAALLPVRGRVYAADIGFGRKPWLVVSNNHRNRAFDDCLAVRLTTTPRQTRSTIVPLGPADSPLVGRVMCDDITLLYREDLLEDLGAVSFATMTLVAGGLRAALDLQ